MKDSRPITFSVKQIDWNLYCVHTNNSRFSDQTPAYMCFYICVDVSSVTHNTDRNYMIKLYTQNCMFFQSFMYIYIYTNTHVQWVDSFERKNRCQKNTQKKIIISKHFSFNNYRRWLRVAFKFALCSVECFKDTFHSQQLTIVMCRKWNLASDWKSHYGFKKWTLRCKVHYIESMIAYLDFSLIIAWINNIICLRHHRNVWYDFNELILCDGMVIFFVLISLDNSIK